MLFVIIGWDKPGQGQTRLDTRPAHLAYLATVKDQLKLAGPFLAADNQTAIGSLMIYECANEAEARAIMESDPFSKAGLFASLDIKPWRQGAGAPLG
jgi:uncharacterized protein YciI